jgi:hypothetical protein
VTARVLSLPFAPAPALSLVVVLAVEPPAGTGPARRRASSAQAVLAGAQARFPAVKSGFAHDSPLEQAGFEPSVPHLIGGVRRAIGKAADKLREAPDAGTRVAESSFFEPPNPPHRLRAIPAAKS